MRELYLQIDTYSRVQRESCIWIITYLRIPVTKVISGLIHTQEYRERESCIGIFTYLRIPVRELYLDWYILKSTERESCIWIFTYLRMLVRELYLDLKSTERELYLDYYILKNTCERVISGLKHTQEYRERVVSGYLKT